MRSVVVLSRFGCLPNRSRARAGALVIAVAAVAVGAGACGADAPQQAATTPVTTVASTTTTTRPVPQPAELKQRALVVADLAPGWAAEPKKDKAAGPSSDPAAEGPTDFLCPEARSSSSPLGKKVDDDENVEVEFTRSASGPFLMQLLDADENAEAQYAEAAKMFGGCVGKVWTMDNDGLTLAMSAAAASAPKVGDEATAYRFTGKAAQAPLTLIIDFVLVRRGAVLQLYGGISADSSLIAAKPMADGELADVVTAGDAKVTAKLNPT
jgi:hypothetical protein